MSDRRAVSAGHVSAGYPGASSVAVEAWRVAVGGNRVESMTVDQIARAFQSGQLSVRTPLWAPGSTGWQALGSFPQFQGQPDPYAGAPSLSQFEEADDDPTRMWTGGDMPGEYAPASNYAGAPAYGEAAGADASRPMSRTGTRPVAAARPPVSRPAPLPPPSVVSRAMPTASSPTASLPAASRTSMPGAMPAARGRNNGLMLVAGLVGLVGLGSAVLAARGNLGVSQPDTAASEASASGAAAAEAAGTGEAPSPGAESARAALAKYEDAPTPAAPAPAEAAAPAAEQAAMAQPTQKEPAEAQPSAAAPQAEAPRAAEVEAPATSKPSKKAREAKEEPTEKKALTTFRRAAPKAKSAALARPEKAERAEKAAEKAERAEKAEHAEKAERAEKTAEKAERTEKAEASGEAAKAAPASAAVNEAAAAALANSANLAASCRPRGGPAGAGKARVIYSNDGEVQSVEILTAKFRDTLTGSCVRMVFRRAKIPAFKGEPPTFIKSFNIPEE